MTDGGEERTEREEAGGKIDSKGGEGRESAGKGGQKGGEIGVGE